MRDLKTKIEKDRTQTSHAHSRRRQDDCHLHGCQSGVEIIEVKLERKRKSSVRRKEGEAVKMKVGKRQQCITKKLVKDETFLRQNAENTKTKTDYY